MDFVKISWGATRECPGLFFCSRFPYESGLEDLHARCFPCFLAKSSRTPSPSGYERPIQDVVRAWAARLADEVRTDRHGNVIAVAAIPNGSPRIMLAGHCDQIGLMVQHIDDNGFLYVQPIGGWDMQILLGQNLTVWARQGPISGVVSRRAPHLLTNEERNKVPQFTDVWVDIGAKDRKEAEELVTLGDPVTSRWASADLLNGWQRRRALDDKVGVWTVMETLRLLHDRPLQAAIFCVSTVQEEDRPARRHHQCLRHPSGGRHRRGCLPRDRYAWQR